ncbi:MAG: NusG domain II-containing protein [Clostridiales bacterium]|jgi:hypothetical protein|nr:NusG domain II-containing protein [Clostridiales bacterium]
MKYAKKSDILVIALIAAAGLLFFLLYRFLLAEKGTYAEIYYRSELVKRIDLDHVRDSTFSIPQCPQVVFRLYNNGGIAFLKSDCPDKLCINSGKLHLSGQFAACLPNRILVKIVSSEKDEPDIIIG